MEKNSSTKNIMYVGALAILILIAGAVMFLYYTQPFEEEISFKNSMNFADIDYTMTTNYNNVQVVSHANIRIGTLKLSNEGYFSQTYAFPQLFGCIKFSTDTENSHVAERQANVVFKSVSGEQTNIYNGYKLEIPVGDKKIYNMTAEYNTYDKSLDYFRTNRPTSLSIYEIPSKERNPLGDIDNYDYNSYLDCNNVGSKKPLKVIEIN